jgi:hypothetical protein
MKNRLYTGLLLLTGCASQREIPKVPVLLIGGCYYYNRPAAGGMFAERVNPFWYRVDGRKGGNLIMNAYGNGYSGRLIQSEKRLTLYSVGVSCSLVDSLTKIAIN